MTTNCPQCEAPITFWRHLRQPTPFRYRCSSCNTKFRLETPRMKTIFLAVCLLFAVLGATFVIGLQQWGVGFGIGFGIVIIGVLLALEVWAQRLITAGATFTKIDEKPKRTATDAPGA
ncbi:MAG: hypothetical protein KY459_12605 [Acidobacteria bacterium]|nr:hypothetical protein [Acidobacteriota bacterium]